MNNPVVFQSTSEHQVASINFEPVSGICDYMDIVWGVKEALGRLEESDESVSYTHLTLPTIYSV